jgi:hypothetical protein
MLGYVRRGWLMGRNGRAHGLSRPRTIEEGSILELFRYNCTFPSQLILPNLCLAINLKINICSRDKKNICSRDKGVDRFKFKETAKIIQELF